jgi:hypothetical protein
MTVDPVPDADLQEQREPTSTVPPAHAPRPDEPEADVLEQEVPVDGGEEDEEEHRHEGDASDWRERYPE